MFSVCYWGVIFVLDRLRPPRCSHRSTWAKKQGQVVDRERIGIFNQDLEGLVGQFQLVMNHLFSWDLLIARANGQVLFFSFGREGPLWKQINVSRSSVAPSDRVGSCRVVRGQRRGGGGSESWRLSTTTKATKWFEIADGAQEGGGREE